MFENYSLIQIKTNSHTVNVGTKKFVKLGYWMKFKFLHFLKNTLKVKNSQ